MNQVQKDLLIEILEHDKEMLDMQDSMEFGEDMIYLIDYAKDIKVMDDE